MLIHSQYDFFFLGVKIVVLYSMVYTGRRKPSLDSALMMNEEEEEEDRPPIRPIALYTTQDMKSSGSGADGSNNSGSKPTTIPTSIDGNLAATTTVTTSTSTVVATKVTHPKNLIFTR